MNRRSFIKRTSLASSALMMPVFLKPFELLADDVMAEKILIIIQLSGGNDGLNTIVPYRNDAYYNARPTLALDVNTLLKVGNEQAFHPALKSLEPIFDSGYMTVLNSVGYPNPDRSHFRSMDIWQSASDANEYISTGWIGRYLDSNCAGCNNAYTAIEVDDALSLAMKGNLRKGMAIKDVNRLYRETREPFFSKVVKNAGSDLLNESNQGYLYKTMVETYSSADYIYNTTKTSQSNFSYPDTQIGRQLKTISQFIQSGLRTKIYYVSHGSFDTHVAQKGQQDRLLREYADAVAALINDLKKGNRFGDVMIMTFSEFGRRVNQNASNGTDHGTANNLFVFGSQLDKKGFYNAPPDLNDLDEGDLKYKIDFRNVYATLLEKWLRVSDGNVISPEFKPLDFI